MKNTKAFFLILNLLLTPIVVFSQETVEDIGVMKETEAFKEGQYDYTGHGTPLFKNSQINGANAVIIGAKGGILLEKSWSLGITAAGLVNNIYFPSYTDSMSFAYAGFAFDYIYQMTDVVGLSAGAVLGGGSINFSDSPTGTDGVWIGEPEVNILFSLDENIKLALTGGYRAVAGVDTAGVNNDKLSSFTYGASISVGNF